MMANGGLRSGSLDDQKSTIPRRLGESKIATEYLSKISNMRSDVRKNRDANRYAKEVACGQDAQVVGHHTAKFADEQLQIR